jgi:hypothetical protein
MKVISLEFHIERIEVDAGNQVGFDGLGFKVIYMIVNKIQGIDLNPRGQSENIIVDIAVAMVIDSVCHDL